MSMSFALFAQRYQDDDFGPIQYVILIITWAVILFAIAGIWKMFRKAGEPGWASIVPIYNAIVLGRIAGLSGFMIFLMFIPCIAIIPVLMLNMKLAERFGKDAGFGVASFFVPFICYPILGFGSAQYQGPLTTRAVLERRNGPPDFRNLP